MSFESPRPAFISPDTREGKYLFLDLNPPRSNGLILVGAGRELCTPDYRIDRSGFEFHTIEFVVGGTWELRFEGRREILRPGAIFGYGPDTAYSLEAVHGVELVKYFLSLSGKGAAMKTAQSGVADCSVHYAHHSRWIHELFDQLLECSQFDPECAREIGTRIAELILLRIGTDAWAGDALRTDGRQTFSRCRAFVQEHYLQLKSVGEIAEGCHVDPAYLARLFKRFGGERPLQLLTRLKTCHAADLILRRGLAVNEAGRAVGFADPYHFSRVFKRVHGVSPGMLRETGSGFAGNRRNLRND